MDEQSLDEKKASVLSRLTELQKTRSEGSVSAAPGAHIPEELSLALEALVVADEELQERNQELATATLRYQTLFEFAPDAYLTTDLNGKIREANRAAAVLFRLAQKDVAGQLLPIFVEDRDRREFRRLLIRVAAGESVRDRDLLIQPPHALAIPCACSVLPLRDAENRVTGLLWLIRDITERKQAQTEIARALEFEQKARQELATAHRALSESEARYRAIAELIPYGGWLADKLGGYTFVSNSFLRLTGLTQAECQGDGWTKCLRPEKAEKVLADWKDCVTNGCNWDYEYEVLSLDGQYRTVLSRGIPLPHQMGQITGWGGLNIDITNRKQAEQALQVAEEHFRVALGDSPLTVFQQDLELRYTWIYHPTQLPAEEIIGRRDADISPPEIAMPLTEIKESVLKSGVGRREQVRWGTKDNVSWVDMTIEPYRGKTSETIGIIGVLTDISDLKRQQHALEIANTQLDRAVTERAAELEEANTRLRELAQAVVSIQEEERRRISRELHDEAGQALTALKMNLEVMRDEMPPELPQFRTRMGEMVSLIADTLEQIRTLAQDLRPPALDAADINTVLDGVCREISRRGRMEVYYRGAPPPAISEAANVTLYRFLQEALTNVVKHAQASEAEVELHSDAEELTLSVRDNGRGFDVRPKWSTLKPQGLGLIGMQERLKTVGGWLEIHSEPGRGTDLVAHIPYKEAE